MVLWAQPTKPGSGNTQKKKRGHRAPPMVTHGSPGISSPCHPHLPSAGFPGEHLSLSLALVITEDRVEQNWSGQGSRKCAQVTGSHPRWGRRTASRNSWQAHVTVTHAGDQGSHRSEAPADSHVPEKPDPIPAASREARTCDGHPQMEASDPNLRVRKPAPRNQAWTHQELDGGGWGSTPRESTAHPSRLRSLTQ